MLTVIVPVHDAFEDTCVCLESLQRTLPPMHRVLLLDDASTDARMPSLLEEVAARSGAAWNVVRQAWNRGFVATANHGMRLAGGDVVLLNSDTIVTRGWLDGLVRCLASDPAIGTATPWTNNGEIASLPVFCRVNPLPADPDAIAAVIAATGTAEYPELPTAVGFCMAIARRAIDRVGVFDESRFGLGYGEENDFSMRVRAAELRNVLCDDVYVAHAGGRSFAPRGLKPGKEAMQRLLDLHPSYLDDVMSFIGADPLANRRRTLVAALENAGFGIG